MTNQYASIDGLDVEQYRQPWESDAQWEERREFIVAYKDLYPTGRLLCLAQVYANVKILDCTYPKEVMIEVEGLAKGLQDKRSK